MMINRSPRQRAAVKELVHCTQRSLPKAKASLTSRTWKARAVLLTREEKKLGSNTQYPTESDDTQAVQLPIEVLEQVLAHLPPLTLATAACVCSEWRNIASANRMWQKFLPESVRGSTDQPEPALSVFAALMRGKSMSSCNHSSVPGIGNRSRRKSSVL